MAKEARDWTTATLAEKMFEIQQRVQPMHKSENNVHERYAYVGAEQAFAAIRALMNEVRVICRPAAKPHEIHTHQTGAGAHRYLTQLVFTYTWVNVDDPKDWWVDEWVGQGVDPNEKGIGKAVTYAKKYYFFDLFVIPRDDDPDTGDRGESIPAPKAPTKTAPPPPAAKPRPAPNEPSKPDFTGILAAATGTYGATNRPSLPPRGECKGSTSEPQVKRMFAIAKKQGWTKEQMEYAVKGLCGVEHSTELGYEQYQWLCGNHEQPGREFYPPMVDGLFETPPPAGFPSYGAAPVTPNLDDDIPF